jgi:CheY-like chemotaxis protein/anti-sigma regulatory factor (Ser/Thr protein kinase)
VPLQLNEIVPEVVELTRARWSTMPQQRGITITLRTELDEKLPPVRGAASEIREALTNLIFNAVDAMPQGGALTLRTRVDRSAQVDLEISDTGVGMDEHARSHCLDPFFTTKGERGSGLGLAMVYGVMQRHGAELQIHSVQGQGTTVLLRFAAAPGAIVPEELPPPTVRTGLKLLVVDDDPVLLRSLRETLQQDEHVVIGAPGGQEGIDAFRTALAAGEPFAAVLTDLGMPHMDGRQVAATVNALSPNTPVIMLTGWGQGLTEGGALPYVDILLSKPPRLRDLREALARCCA